MKRFWLDVGVPFREIVTDRPRFGLWSSAPAAVARHAVATHQHVCCGNKAGMSYTATRVGGSQQSSFGAPCHQDLEFIFHRFLVDRCCFIFVVVSCIKGMVLRLVSLPWRTRDVLNVHPWPATVGPRRGISRPPHPGGQVNPGPK